MGAASTRPSLRPLVSRANEFSFKTSSALRREDASACQLSGHVSQASLRGALATTQSRLFPWPLDCFACARNDGQGCLTIESEGNGRPIVLLSPAGFSTGEMRYPPRALTLMAGSGGDLPRSMRNIVRE